jgi:hypothetical protein
VAANKDLARARDSSLLWLATLAGVSAKDRQSARGQMGCSDGQAISDAAAELVLKWWPDALPRSPDEAIARLRRAFPPGATAYTVSLPQTDGDERLVAVCARRTPGVAYSLLSGGWQRPYFENFSWDIARIGACPVVGDNGLKALKIADDVDLDTMMAQSIWREPRVGAPLTHSQQRWVRLAVRRIEAHPECSVRRASFFNHQELIR